MRQDFWLARSFRNPDDLNAQFDDWRTQIANPRVHATTRRVVDQHFAEERPALIAHPAIPYSAVLTIERRVSREGMVSVGGNLYSIPDTARKRVLEVAGDYALVYLVFNGISNLLTQAEQVECFRNAARHLRRGGRFVLEHGGPTIPHPADPQAVVDHISPPLATCWSIQSHSTSSRTTSLWGRRGGTAVPVPASLRLAGRTRSDGPTRRLHAGEPACGLARFTLHRGVRVAHLRNG